ncbi:MAG: hypothetical protein ChlgKO_11270 [Chlamydiales bacterium]
MSVGLSVEGGVRTNDFQVDSVEETLNGVEDIIAPVTSQESRSLQGRVTVDIKKFEFSDLDPAGLKKELVLMGFSEGRSEELSREFEGIKTLFLHCPGFKEGNLLHLIAAFGNRADVSILLDKIEASSFNDSRKAAVMFAAEFDNQEIVDLFIEKQIACKPYLKNISRAIKENEEGLVVLRSNVHALCKIYGVKGENDLNEIANKIWDFKDRDPQGCILDKIIRDMRFVEFISAFGSQQALEVALRCGEDFVSFGDTDQTPISQAVYYNNSETVIHLLSLDVDLHLNEQNVDGETPGYVFLVGRGDFPEDRQIASLFIAKGYNFYEGFDKKYYQLTEEEKDYLASFQGGKTKRAQH